MKNSSVFIITITRFFARGARVFHFSPTLHCQHYSLVQLFFYLQSQLKVDFNAQRKLEPPMRCMRQAHWWRLQTLFKMQHIPVLVLRIRVANHQKRVPSEVPDVRRRNELVNFLIRRFSNARSEGLLRL
jgi:hypothetical protein